MEAVLSIVTYNAPNILPFLLVIIIPIVVHLFNLRRVKKIEFSNTAFLRKVKDETSSKRKPKELLILASRILAVAFLVLAFAQPLIKNSGSEEFGNAVFIYLDNSPSMSGSIDGASKFDLANRKAQAIIDSYPEGTKFRFIENNYSNSVLSTYSKSSLSDLLTELSLSNVGRTPKEIFSRVNSNGFEGDLYFISDFSDIGQLSLDGVSGRIDFFFVPIESGEVPNLYIDSVFLENTFLSGEFANSLGIKVQKEFSDFKNVSAKVYFDNKLAGTLPFNFENSSSASATYELPNQQIGLTNIRIELDDASLSFDNNFYLSVNSVNTTSVVEIYEQGNSSYIKSLFENNEFFDFKRTSINSLDNEMLQNANVIFINGITNYSNQLINSLKSFSQNGGRVVIIPSSDLAVQNLNALEISLANDSEEMLQLEVPDFSNPFFDGVFEEESEDLNMPEATTSFRLLNLEYSLLSFRNGRSFLGKVANSSNFFFFTSPFETELTSFPNHALFVPVMYKLALGSQSEFSNLYFRTDSEVIQFPLKNLTSRNQVFSLIRGEEEIIPDQRILNNQLIMEIPKEVISPGSYEVVAEDRVLGSISFNYPKDESIQNDIQIAAIQAMADQGIVTILDEAEPASLKTELEARFIGLPLWRYALGLALLFLFVEIILIRYL